MAVSGFLEKVRKGLAKTRSAMVERIAADGEVLLAAADDEKVKAAYGENTEQALAAGVFGAPSYVIDDELYWGQDRLDFLDRALGES